MKLRDVLKGLTVSSMHADGDTEITGITSDSRLVEPGNLFCALRGYQSDGHRFIGAAVASGAACALCETSPEGEVPHLTVEDARHAMALAAANFYGRPADGMTVVGVTGTNGKTTVTTLLKDMIEQMTGKPCGLVGTVHNMIGDRVIETQRTTPESTELHRLFREMRGAGCEYVLMEVTSHALRLERVAGIRFAAGVFTNLTEDHLDFHRDMDDYADAKALLFRQSDTAVINADDAYAGKMIAAAAGIPVLTFAADTDASVTASRVQLRPGSVRFQVTYGEETHEAGLEIPGRFSVYNGLAALSTCTALGFPMDAAVEALAECPGVRGRAEVVFSGGFTVLVDYAHTPDALENILRTVRQGAKGRVVSLFGCGGDRDRSKRPIMGEIAARLSDFVYVTSDNPRSEKPASIIWDILEGMKGSSTPFTMIEDRREAIERALGMAMPGDVILLAGKGHETYIEKDGRKTFFDERQVVRDYFRQPKPEIA